MVLVSIRSAPAKDNDSAMFIVSSRVLKNMVPVMMPVMVSVSSRVSSSVREKIPRNRVLIESVDNTVSSRVLANIVAVATESVRDTVSSAEHLDTVTLLTVSIVALSIISLSIDTTLSSRVHETPRNLMLIVAVDNTVSFRVLANIVAVVIVSVDNTVSSSVLANMVAVVIVSVDNTVSSMILDS